MGKVGTKVLLVDDNLDNRTVYSVILEHFGFQVETAQDGQVGIDRARGFQPEIILMDISMPIIDGWEASTILKADPITSHIPIVILTAYARTEDKERAKKIGCCGFLTKPCEPKNIVAEIYRVLPGLHDEASLIA